MVLERFKRSKEEGIRAPEIEMGFIGDSQVITNIVKKSEFLKVGDPAHQYIRTNKIDGGGGQQGVFQGGVSIGFERRNLTDAIDTYVSVSCGVAAAYYSLGGHAAWGTTIYTQDNVDNRLFNPKIPHHLYDADTLEWVFRYEKPIDYNYFRSRRSHFFAGITDAKTGKGSMVDVKTLEDPLSALMASVNIPIVNGGKIVEIDGIPYFDGTLAYPLPIYWCIENLNPTDILVVLTSPLDKWNSGMESLGRIAGLFGVSKPIQEHLKTFKQRYKEELAFITGERKLPKGVRIAAIYPKRSPLRAHTTNRRLLLQAADTAQRFTEELIARYSRF